MLSVPDFVATLVTEAVVHHLDLSVDLPSAPPPTRPRAVAVSTMDGLLSDEVVRPTDWSDANFLLKPADGTLEPRDRWRSARPPAGFRCQLRPHRGREPTAGR